MLTVDRKSQPKLAGTDLWEALSCMRQNQICVGMWEACTSGGTYSNSLSILDGHTRGQHKCCQDL